MKKILLFASALFFYSNYLQAQEHFAVPRLNYTQGKGVQKGKFEAGGIGLQYERYRNQNSKLGLIASVDWQLSGTETKTIDLSFNNNNRHTDVNYSSSMNRLMGGVIFTPLNGSFISPFISVQGGTLWYRTKFYINDPTDNDYCSPEDNRNVKMSFALAGNVESGIKVRIRNQKGRMLYAQAGVGYTIGTKSSYIKLGDEAGGENTQSYTSKFRMSDGSRHQHAIGTLYRTGVSQLVYSVGVSFQFFLDFARSTR